MAKQHTILEVFIASPGDVASERKVLEDVVAEFNLTWGDKHKVRLELVMWESHSRPGFGEDGQDVINHQIGDSYDIFLGIMWGRFGTATGRAESGTEEEFSRAYARLRKGDLMQMMFYFKNAGIPLNQMDAGQFSKVQSFKKKIAEEYGALYYEFETTEDFQTKARIHLSKVVQDWLDTNSSNIESKKSTEPVSLPTFNPLANLTALDEADNEDGIIDLVERGTNALNEVTEIINHMSEATIDLGQKTNQRVAEINKITAGGMNADVKSAKRISNAAANDLDVFVNRMSVEIPEFYKQNSLFTESFGQLAMMAENEGNNQSEEVQTTLLRMKEFRTAIETSSESLAGMRNSISKLPSMTTAFNRARRRAVAVMDDLLTQLQIASNQVGDIEALLLRLIG